MVYILKVQMKRGKVQGNNGKGGLEIIDIPRERLVTTRRAPDRSQARKYGGAPRCQTPPFLQKSKKCPFRGKMYLQCSFNVF